MNGKQCPNCGMQNDINSFNCSNCGSNLNVMPQMQQQPMNNQPMNQQPVNNVPVQPMYGQQMNNIPMQPMYQQNMYNGQVGFNQPQKKKLSTGTIIGIVVGAVVALVAIIAIIAGSSNSIKGNTYKKEKNSGTIITTTYIYFDKNGTGSIKIEAQTIGSTSDPYTIENKFTYKVSGSKINIKLDTGDNPTYKIDGNCVVNLANNSTYCK